MTAEFRTWDQPPPENAGGVPLLLLDMSCVPENQWKQPHPGAAQRFTMGN